MTRPMLKGVFHVIALFIYSFLFPHLTDLIPPTLKIPLTIYLLSAIGNFAASSLFHIFPWPDNLIIYPRRFDHIMIFTLIVATYYAMISTFVPEVNLLVKSTLVIGTILGIVSRLCFTDANTTMIAIPYIMVGWCIILDPYSILSMFFKSLPATILSILAGAAYTTGAIIYMLKFPQLCPKIMGYHELFHLFVIIGTSLFTICIFFHGIPYHQQTNK